MVPIESKTVTWIVIGTGAIALLAALLLTRMVLASAVKTGLLDVPNDRSAHTVPTPRGGGLAIVVTITIGTLVFLALDLSNLRLALAILVGGIAISVVGFIDDRAGLTAASRLAVHFSAALLAIFVLGGVPPIPIGSRVVDLGLLGDVLGILAIVWSINLFNFMDGIDGLAGAEAVFVCLAGALLGVQFGASQSVTAVALVTGCACAGFLWWNWPPARIFMGDVGSGYLGYVIAVLGLAAASENPAALYAWLILGGLFFADATVTLIARLARGERVHEAHNIHAYQCLARRWKSHGKVSALASVVNLFWLMPLAWVALKEDQWGPWLAVVAIAPLALLSFRFGAGARE